MAPTVGLQRRTVASVHVVQIIDQLDPARGQRLPETGARCLFSPLPINSKIAGIARRMGLPPGITGWVSRSRGSSQSLASWRHLALGTLGRKFLAQGAFQQNHGDKNAAAKHDDGRKKARQKQAERGHRATIRY